MSIQPHDKTAAQPGWNPNPEGGSALRGFNGTDWTHQYQPTAQQFAPAPPAERRFAIHYGFALVALFSLGATLLFGIPMIATAADKKTENVGAVIGLFWMLWGGMWTVVWTAFSIQHTLRGRQ